MDLDKPSAGVRYWGLIILVALVGVGASFARVWTCPQCLGGHLVEVDQQGTTEGFRLHTPIRCECCGDRRKVSIYRKLSCESDGISLPVNAKIVYEPTPPGKPVVAPAVQHTGPLSEKAESTQQLIQDICSVIELYRHDQGKYPEKWADLISRPSGIDPKDYPKLGYLKEYPKDAWNNYLMYRIPGAKGRPYEVASFGSDGMQGGEGDARDIWSYEVYKRK